MIWIRSFALLILVIVAFALGMWAARPAFSDLVDLLSVLLSWPPVAAIVITWFLLKYREPISEWIKHLHVKTPDGTEFASIQRQPSDGEKDLLLKYLTHVEEERDQTKTEFQAQQEELENEKQIRQFWWFRFLNEHLFSFQKEILRLIDRQQPSLDDFHRGFSNFDLNTSTNILNLLSGWGLVRIIDNKLFATDQGKAFIGFLNWLTDREGPNAALSLADKTYLILTKESKSPESQKKR